MWTYITEGRVSCAMENERLFQLKSILFRRDCEHLALKFYLTEVYASLQRALPSAFWQAKEAKTGYPGQQNDS